MSNIVIRTMQPADADAVLRIYGEGIGTGHATFQDAIPAWEDWDRGHAVDCRFVAQIGDNIAGWAALAPVSQRPVYRGVAENSVYVGANHRRLGVGDALMAALVPASEAHGYWTLQAGIFPENAASIALHERHGFRVLGIRERIGRMSYGPLAGRWRDVVSMQRRSNFAGID